MFMHNPFVTVVSKAEVDMAGEVVAIEGAAVDRWLVCVVCKA